ncbi:MAG TPA: hypothetical protein VGE11_14940 [Pseudonocardia sp.]
MTAPVRSLTELAKVGQDSVGAAIRIWTEMTQASVKVITASGTELLDGRRVAGLMFGFANQVLDNQRALLSAVLAGTNGRSAVAAPAEATSAAGVALAEAGAEVAETAAATEKAAVETAFADAAEVLETAAETAEAAEAPIDTAGAPAETAETADAPAETAEASAAEAEPSAEKPKKAKAVKATKTPEIRIETEEAAAEAVAEAEKATVAEAPYGEGSHAPLADRSEVPTGFTIKANKGSKLYHVPVSPFYTRTIAEVWFASPEAAEAAGFQRPVSQR